MAGFNGHGEGIRGVRKAGVEGGGQKQAHDAKAEQTSAHLGDSAVVDLWPRYLACFETAQAGSPVLYTLILQWQMPFQG